MEARGKIFGSNICRCPLGGTERPVSGSGLTLRSGPGRAVVLGPGAEQGAQRRRAIACPPPGQAICQSRRIDRMFRGGADIKRAEIPSDRLPADMRRRGSPIVRIKPDLALLLPRLTVCTARILLKNSA